MSERPAKSNSGHGVVGVDRLSALPDALLHCVISFLTSRQAVRTCTLSRRWRNLWRSAPSLDVDSDNTAMGGADSSKLVAATVAATASGAGEPPEMPWEEFKSFVAKLLRHHSAPVLDRFRLRVSTYRHERADIAAHVAGWILRGASYRPAALEVSLHAAASYVRMPPLLLGTGGGSRLTRLCLSGVLLDGGFAGYLQTGGCPVLRDLVLRGCALDDFEEIVSGTLRRLTFYGCTAKRRLTLNADKWRVRVTAPCLVSVVANDGYGRRNVITLSRLLRSTEAKDEAESRVVSTTNEIMLIIL